ncbi:hypothetical protein EBU99_06350 [bacterium]|nr:hypothetical protein [bacterium]
MNDVSLPPLKLSCVSVVLFAIVQLMGCGHESSEKLSHLASDVQKNYGISYDVPLKCGGSSAAQTIDIVLESAERLSDFCEKQNVVAASQGYLRCPVGLCQQEYKPGSVAAPTMKFSINNGSSMSGMFGGFGGSSGGSSGSDSVFGKRLYVTLEFNLPLARSPDELACVNPMSSSVQSTILNEITKAALNASSQPCPNP